jgi:Homing endonuclease associated repeat
MPEKPLIVEAVGLRWQDALKALQRLDAASRPPAAQHGVGTRAARLPLGSHGARALRPLVDALHAAGLEPRGRQPYQLRSWRREEILASLRDWSQQHGRPPLAFDWIRAGLRHPCSSTVRNHFGPWKSALAAA